MLRNKLATNQCPVMAGSLGSKIIVGLIMLHSVAHRMGMGALRTTYAAFAPLLPPVCCLLLKLGPGRYCCIVNRSS